MKIFLTYGHDSNAPLKKPISRRMRKVTSSTRCWEEYQSQNMNSTKLYYYE